MMKPPGMPPDKGGGSYASRVSKTITNSEYEDRNVIVIRLRKTNEQAKASLNDDICDLVLKKLNISVSNDTIGAQYLYDKGDELIDDLAAPAQDSSSLHK